MIIDMDIIRELKKMNETEEDDFFGEILTLFQTELPGLQKEIYNSYKEDNLFKMAKAAHTLKGASLNLGATDLANICDKLEVAGKENQIKIINDLMSELENTLELTLNKLNEISKQLNKRLT
jgi:HPt (histidine-containing phosphotransfer) domain-containing protein